MPHFPFIFQLWDPSNSLGTASSKRLRNPCYKLRTWVDLLDMTSMAKGCCQFDSGTRYARLCHKISS